MMIRIAKSGKRARMWLVGVGVIAFLAVSGGVAAARSDRSGNGPARDAQSVARTTTSKAANTVKAPQRGRKPRPTPTPTTSPTSSPTPTPTTSPSTGTDVQISLPGFVPNYRFGDVLVDEARSRIYITGGTHTSDLVITDLDGGNVRTLAGIAPGGAGMALSPDGTKLYIAASDQDWIRIVDTTTFALSGQFAGKTDGTMTCPRDVAFAAGSMWISWGCDNAPAGIGRVDLQTGAFDVNVTEGDGNIRTLFSTAPLLATLPNEPNIVIAGETGSNPADLYRFEATSTRLVMRAMGSTNGGSVRQMAVTPDGSQIIIPSGAPYYHQVFRTSDLTLAGRYPTAAYPNSVAIRDDGLVVAGIDGAYEEDVYVFEPGGSTPIATYEFGHLPNQETWPYTVVPGGLAVHGNRIYAITQVPGEPNVVTLRIRTLP
jgi:DNA-binding beta-propeller fold protein YncE